MREAAVQRALLANGRAKRAWTVSFSKTGITPHGVREDLARDMVARVGVGNQRVRNDFDRVPIFQRPICNATWDKTERRWINIVLEGEEGFSYAPEKPYREVLYRAQPFWYRVEMEGISNPSRVSVSDHPLEGYRLAPMFPNGKDYVYRPCFEMGLGDDGLPHSRAGLKPLYTNAKTLMEHARAYDEGAHTERSAEWFSDLLLQWVEFATKRVQEGMRGFTRHLHRLDPLEFLRHDDKGRAVLLLPAARRKEFSVGVYGHVSDLTSGKTLSAEAEVIEILPASGGDFQILLSTGLRTENLTLDENGRASGVSVLINGIRSGGALGHVKASSGMPIECADGFQPAVWRGKENPWGGRSSLLCDLRISRPAGEMSLYYLQNLRDWQAQGLSGWQKSECVSTVASVTYITSYQADTAHPHLMLPVSVQGSPAKYFSAYFAAAQGEALSVFTGGTRTHNDAINSATYTAYPIATANSGQYGGARLVLGEV